MKICVRMPGVSIPSSILVSEIPNFVLFLNTCVVLTNGSKVARSREENCADRAKFLLDEMGRLYNEGNTELLPHAVSFGAIINAVSFVHIRQYDHSSILRRISLTTTSSYILSFSVC